MLELCYLFGMVFNLGDLCNPSKADSIKRPSEKIGATLHLLKKLHINRPILSLGLCFGGKLCLFINFGLFSSNIRPRFQPEPPQDPRKNTEKSPQPVGP